MSNRGHEVDEPLVTSPANSTTSGADVSVSNASQTQALESSASKLNISGSGVYSSKAFQPNALDSAVPQSGVSGETAVAADETLARSLDPDENNHQRKGKKSPSTAAQRAISQTRLIAAIPAVGLALCSIVLVIATTVDAVITTIEFIGQELDISTLTIEYVEYTDMYLLGVVLFMTALGLTTLFITQKIPLPSWLEFHDFDDLKERLISVIVVMLGVHFLGVVLKGEMGLDLLWLGIGICVVIIALTAFTSAIFKSH